MSSHQGQESRLGLGRAACMAFYLDGQQSPVRELADDVGAAWEAEADKPVPCHLAPGS